MRLHRLIRPRLRRALTAATIAVSAACGADSAPGPATEAPVRSTDATAPAPASTAPPTTVDPFAAEWIATHQPDVDSGTLITAIRWRDRVIGIVDGDPDGVGAAISIERFADPYVTGREFNESASGGGCETHHWYVSSGDVGGFAFVVVHDPTDEITFVGRDDVEWFDTIDGRRVGFIAIAPGHEPPAMRFVRPGGVPATC